MSAREQDTCVQTSARAERIALLNGTLRKTGQSGRIMITRGVEALPMLNRRELLAALAQYDHFNADNEPHRERDFGRLTYAGAEILWSVSYYDLTLTRGSVDPGDVSVTVRVLTIMLAAEY
jgi:hypothetical protein